MEAIEFRVQEASAVTGISLMDLQLKKNLLVAAITRNGKMIIPTGTDTIEVNDNVVIVTTHSGFGDLQDILL